MATKPKKNEKENKTDVKKVASAKGKTEVKEETKRRPEAFAGAARGRKKGVTYKVKDKYKDQVGKIKESFLSSFEEFEPNLDKFLDNGNKSAAREARKFIMEMQKYGKELRNLIQEAKENLVEEKAV